MGSYDKSKEITLGETPSEKPTNKSEGKTSLGRKKIHKKKIKVPYAKKEFDWSKNEFKIPTRKTISLSAAIEDTL